MNSRLEVRLTDLLLTVLVALQVWGIVELRSMGRLLESIMANMPTR
jgi:hypothetical protein